MFVFLTEGMRLIGTFNTIIHMTCYSKHHPAAVIVAAANEQSRHFTTGASIKPKDHFVSIDLHG